MSLRSGRLAKMLCSSATNWDFSVPFLNSGALAYRVVCSRLPSASYRVTVPQPTSRYPFGPQAFLSASVEGSSGPEGDGAGPGFAASSAVPSAVLSRPGGEFPDRPGGEVDPSFLRKGSP